MPLASVYGQPFVKSMVVISAENPVQELYMCEYEILFIFVYIPELIVIYLPCNVFDSFKGVVTMETNVDTLRLNKLERNVLMECDSRFFSGREINVKLY